MLYEVITRRRLARTTTRLQLRLDRIREHIALDRLDEIGVCAGDEAGVDRLAVREHGHHHDRRLRVRRGGADFLQYLDAADARHHQIEHDRVVGIVACETQGLLAGAGELRLRAQRTRQLMREQRARRLLVVDDQNAMARRGADGLSYNFV